jgi:hypothetical protein
MDDGDKVACSGAGLPKVQHTEPSSSTAGFFQEQPKLINGLAEDATFRRVLECM